MLRHAQGGKSVSDAMLWSLNIALNSYQVALGKTLADVLDRVWSSSTNRALRLLGAFHFQPSLVSFEDRAACQFVVSSSELHEIHRQYEERKSRKARSNGADAWKQKMLSAYDQFIAKHWQKISDVAVEHQNSGKPLTQQSLVDAANVRHDSDMLKAMLMDVDDGK